MRAATGSESIREPEEVLLVDRVQQRDHRPLDDLVRQGCDRERALLCVRCVLCWPAFPLVPALCSIGSAADCSALFADFQATTAGSDFSGPFIIGYGSSPSRCGPVTATPFRSDPRPPSFRCDPVARD